MICSLLVATAQLALELSLWRYHIFFWEFRTGNLIPGQSFRDPMMPVVEIEANE
jgi:hypothetical protein